SDTGRRVAPVARRNRTPGLPLSPMHVAADRPWTGRFLVDCRFWLRSTGHEWFFPGQSHDLDWLLESILIPEGFASTSRAPHRSVGRRARSRAGPRPEAAGHRLRWTAVADVSVQPAGAGDVSDIARIQLDTWRQAYARWLPESVLASITLGEAERSWRGGGRA